MFHNTWKICMFTTHSIEYIVTLLLYNTEYYAEPLYHGGTYSGGLHTAHVCPIVHHSHVCFYWWHHFLKPTYGRRNYIQLGEFWWSISVILLGISGDDWWRLAPSTVGCNGEVGRFIESDNNIMVWLVYVTLLFCCGRLGITIVRSWMATVVML